MSALRFPALLAALLLPACGVGEIGPGPSSDPDPSGGPDAGPDIESADAAPSAPDAAPPDYQLAVGPAGAALKLGEVAEFDITLTSERFAGPVTLSATGMPASWNVTFEPSNTIDLAYDGVANATMLVEVPSDGEAVNASISVNADASPGPRLRLAPVSVANELVITIDEGVGGGQHTFPSATTIRLGASVTIMNADGTNHRIHSDNGDANFPHQDNEMSQGESYSFTIDQTGQFDYYCHIHQVGAGVGAIMVVTE